mgnify:CR=1 FL=1
MEQNLIQILMYTESDKEKKMNRIEKEYQDILENLEAMVGEMQMNKISLLDAIDGIISMAKYYERRKDALQKFKDTINFSTK